MRNTHEILEVIDETLGSFIPEKPISREVKTPRVDGIIAENPGEIAARKFFADEGLF